MQESPVASATRPDGGGSAWRRLAAVVRRLRPFQVAIVFAIALAALIWLNARHLYGGNLSGFICLGDRFIARSELPSRILQIGNSVGYDGQFFFFIAHDPLLLGKWKQHIDRPAYRYQRILYPALSGAVAGWRTKWIPRALVIVNWAALGLGVWCMASYMAACGRSPWIGALFGVLPGCLLGLHRDLCDPLAVVLLAASFVAYDRGRVPWACAGMAAALLTRETTALALAVLVGETVLRRRFRAAGGFILAALPFVVWTGYVWFRAGEPPWCGGSGNFGAPFVAMLNYGKGLLHDGSKLERVFFVVFAAQAAVCVVLAVFQAWKRPDAMSVAFLIFAAMPFVMSRFVWVEPWSYARVLVSGAAFLLLAYGRTGSRVLWIPMGLNLALLPLTLDYVR